MCIPSSLQTAIFLVLSCLALTCAKNTLSDESADDALRAAEEIRAEMQEDPEAGSLAYVLSNFRNMRQRRNDGYSIFAPPSGLSKLSPHYRAPMKKRDRHGFWIWMPAQGYVSVPRGEVAGGDRKGGSNSNLLRYG